MDAKPISTLMDPNAYLMKWEDPILDSQSSTLYMAAIGSLMYMATGTWVDIVYTVQNLSQFTQNPGPEHCAAIKRVLRYLKGPMDYGLVYGGDLAWPEKLTVAYTDAD